MVEEEKIKLEQDIDKMKVVGLRREETHSKHSFEVCRGIIFKIISKPPEQQCKGIHLIHLLHKP